MRHEINRPPIAVILAAGVGSRPSPMTNATAACLLSIGGSVILERTIRNCLSCGISQFVLVLGHGAEDVKKFVDKTFRGIRVTYVVNDRYRETNTGYSVMLASSAVGAAEFITFDADVVFDAKILRQLLDRDLPNVLCIDRNFAQSDQVANVTTDDQLRVIEFGMSVEPIAAQGRAIWIDKISAVTGLLLFAELAQMMDSPKHAQIEYGAAYARLVTNGMPFHALDITRLKWTDVGTDENLAAANAMFKSPVTTVSRSQQRALDEAAD